MISICHTLSDLFCSHLSHSLVQNPFLGYSDWLILNWDAGLYMVWLQIWESLSGLQQSSSLDHRHSPLPHNIYWESCCAPLYHNRVLGDLGSLGCFYASLAIIGQAGFTADFASLLSLFPYVNGKILGSTWSPTRVRLAQYHIPIVCTLATHVLHLLSSFPY